MAQKKATTKKGKAANTKAKKTPTKENIGNRAFIYALILFVIGVLFGIFMFVDSEPVVNRFFKGLILGLFGRPGVLVPFILMSIGVYICIKKSNMAEKIIYSVISLSLVSAMFHLGSGIIISISESIRSAATVNISDSIGGGFFGAIIACPLYMLVNRVASYIIVIVLFLIFISLLMRYSVFAAIVGWIRGFFSTLKDTNDNIDRKQAYDNSYEKSKKVVKKVKEIKKPKDTEIFDAANSFREENRKEENGEKKPVTPKSIKEKQKLLVDSVEEGTQKTFDYDTGIDEIFKDVIEDSEDEITPLEDTDIPDSNSNVSTHESMKEEIMNHMEEATEDKPRKKKGLTDEEREEVSSTLNSAIDTPTKEYVFPSIGLLNISDGSGGDSRQVMLATANKLISVLDNFGVKAKLLQVTQGPAVTRYEIQPNTGVKLSKITGLADDLALNLAVTTVLVAPVPGKAAVGIEVPNKETSAVSAREILESSEFIKSKSKLTIALGKDIGGHVVVGNIAKMPHLLIAGSTGSGKSVCINTIITSLLYKASPDEVKLIMVDPKVVELGVYNGIPHLLIPVVTDPKKAAGALNWSVIEMMRRYDVFAENYVKNLEGYNQLMEKTGGVKMPQIVIVIDELADLMMVAAKEVEDYICRLAQLARAAGIHLIVATQRPTVDVITGLIKANIPSRIAFAVASQVDSRTILDKSGAEKLLGRGDMLYAPQGSRSPLRVQGAYVSDDELERLLDFLKKGNEENHYSQDLEEHIERVATGDSANAGQPDDDGDELLPQAIELAVELGQISTAMIQRRLKVGYSRAGRIIDQMEDRGIISGANGSKPRQVYINHADLMSSSNTMEE